MPTSLEPLIEQERVNDGPRPVHPLEGVPHEWAEGRALTGPQHKLAARLEHTFSTITYHRAGRRLPEMQTQEMCCTCPPLFNES